MSGYENVLKSGMNEKNRNWGLHNLFIGILTFLFL